MRLSDRLHCPACNGRLASASADVLRCVDCQRAIQIVDGIADFAGDLSLLDASTDRYQGDLRDDEGSTDDLIARIRAAANDHWPGALGDTIEFGCGRGGTTQAIAVDQTVRSLLVFDTDPVMLRACRTRITALGLGPDRPVGYATLSGAENAIRDSVADTVIGSVLLSGIGDLGAFLAMVHRVLKPGGRAGFAVPNRRYHEAMCRAMAEALVQRHARDGAWPEGKEAALEILARTRRLLIHRGDLGFLSGLDEKHLFNSEELEDLAQEAGFATAEMIPLDPDPAGSETTRRLCHQAGAPSSFTEAFAPLAASVGEPYFNLLARQDSSASMLLWLTKGTGPGVRIFTSPRSRQQIEFAGPDAALGGVVPRWSVELLARDTPDGVLVSLGGWCLCNTDVLWVRLTLDDVIRHAPVWRPRPDVHAVLNRDSLYHPFNTLCSGLASEMLFDGVHPMDGTCGLRLEVVLASGLVVTGPAPEKLLMHEQTVIAH